MMLVACCCALVQLPTRPAAMPHSFSSPIRNVLAAVHDVFILYVPFLFANVFELGHTIRRQTAGQFGPDLAKKLSQLVKMEKNVMRSMELVGRERMEVAVRYEFWRTTTID
jgi:hypothetical protein